MAFTLFSRHSITSFHGSGPQVAGLRFRSPPSFSRGRGSGKGGVGVAAGGLELLEAAPGLPLHDKKVWEQTVGACEESFQCYFCHGQEICPGHISVMSRRHSLELGAIYI